MKSEKIVGHDRTTPQEVHERWKEGLYKARGYLYALIKSLRKDGWKLVIKNVAQFCETWGINIRTFYRVKDQLLRSGKIMQVLDGYLKLWIPPKSDTKYIANDSPNGMNDTDSNQSVTEISPKCNSSNNSGDSTTLFPVSSTDLSLFPTFPAARENMDFPKNASPTISDREDEKYQVLGDLDQPFVESDRIEDGVIEGVNNSPISSPVAISSAPPLGQVLKDSLEIPKKLLENADSETVSAVLPGNQELREFIKRSNEYKEARRPDGFLWHCIRNDRENWTQKYQEYQRRAQESAAMRESTVAAKPRQEQPIRTLNSALERLRAKFLVLPDAAIKEIKEKWSQCFTIVEKDIVPLPGIDLSVPIG